MSTVSPSDLLLPVMPDAPREWEQPDELVEAAVETVPGTGGVILTEAAWRAREVIAARRWFLIRNEPGNEPSRSVETNRKEQYFTYLGIERPWNGLDDVGAWLMDEIDPARLDEASTEELVNAILGSWLALGRIEYISDATARDLSMRIYLKSRGRVDLYAMAQPDERERRKRAALEGTQRKVHVR